MDKPIHIYRPDNSLQGGLLAALVAIAVELRRNRWLTYQLFRRDLQATYKQSLMGILWAFIIPFAGVATIVLLDSSGVMSIGTTRAPYPLFAVMGLAIWQLFAAGLVNSANALVNAGTMLLKINFSKKSLVLASAAQASVPFAMQLALLAVLCAWYGYLPGPEVLLLPLLILPILLLTAGLGFILALLNAVFRDVGSLVSIALTFLMFLTPVLYARPTTGFLARVTDYSPLYYLVAVPRDLILHGERGELGGFFASSALALLIFLACALVFHLTESRVAERV